MLERLHASFFFYMLTGPDDFIVIGKYLTSAVLVGIGLELNGLHGWVASGWLQSQAGSTWLRVSRPTSTALAIMIATHLVGLLFSVLVTGGGHNVWNFIAVSRSGLTAVPRRVGMGIPTSHFNDCVDGALSSRLHVSPFNPPRWRSYFVHSYILYVVHCWHCRLSRFSAEF